MKAITKTILTAVLLGEIVMFTGIFCFGPQGMRALAQEREENCILEQRVRNLEVEIANIDAHIAEFEETDFYKEKIARESLQMAHPGDVVYYIS